MQQQILINKKLICTYQIDIELDCIFLNIPKENYPSLVPSQHFEDTICNFIMTIENKFYKNIAYLNLK